MVAKTKHTRLVERMKERIAANDRAGRVTDMSRRDYRWWEAIKAGIPVNRPECYTFWCSLHHQTRDLFIRRHTLLTVSTQDRDDCAEESKEFFRKALSNPRLHNNRSNDCTHLNH